MANGNGSINILERSVCLVLKRSYLGNDRKVDISDVVEAAHGTEELDDEAFRSGIKLIAQHELRPCNSIISQATSYLVGRSIPGHRVFGNSTFLIPLDAVEEVDQTLRGYRHCLDIEAHRLAERYAAAVERQRVKLRSAFDINMYPSPDQVASRWDIDWDYLNFSTPERLESVSHAIYENAQRKASQRLTSMAEEARNFLTQSLLDISSEIVRKLTPDDDGKPKNFRATILDPLIEFMETFRSRNSIINHADLERIVERLRAATHGLDPEQLKNTETARLRVLNDMRAAVSQLDGMVTKGRRAISFKPLNGNGE